MNKLVKVLRKESVRLLKEATGLLSQGERLTYAANILAGVGAKGQAPKTKHKKRHLSAAGKKTVALAQKKRWAKFHKKNGHGKPVTHKK
jgi:hypothetical protein